MQWWWTKTSFGDEDNDGVQETNTNNLTICFTDNRILSFSVPIVLKEGEDIKDYDLIEPWKTFYDWYKDGVTDKFELTYNNGVYLLPREQIKYINIRINKENKPS